MQHFMYDAICVLQFVCVCLVDTYFGPGTVDNIKCHLNDAESKAMKKTNFGCFFI